MDIVTYFTSISTYQRTDDYYKFIQQEFNNILTLRGKPFLYTTRKTTENNNNSNLYKSLYYLKLIQIIKILIITKYYSN